MVAGLTRVSDDLRGMENSLMFFQKEKNSANVFLNFGLSAAAGCCAPEFRKIFGSSPMAPDNSARDGAPSYCAGRGSYGTLISRTSAVQVKENNASQKWSHNNSDLGQLMAGRGMNAQG